MGFGIMRRIWRPIVLVSSVCVLGVFIYDATILSLSYWAQLRSQKRKGKDKRMKPPRDALSKDALRRKLVFFYLPMRIVDWFLGEDERSAEFFAEPAEEEIEDPALQTQVLFFPDAGIPCKDFYNSRAGCPRDNCPFLHEKTAYQSLINLLRSAQKTLDVCVFCITCADLVSVLVERQCNAGVEVRVITDSEQLRVTGSQIGKLRTEGVKVRHDNTSYLMHHKFAIIDNETLLNGSFNWTRTAITGNHENLVISKDEYLVRAFRKEFDSLWTKFHPKHQKGFSEKPTRDTWVTTDYMR